MLGTQTTTQFVNPLIGIIIVYLEPLAKWVKFFDPFHSSGFPYTRPRGSHAEQNTGPAGTGKLICLATTSDSVHGHAAFFLALKSRYHRDLAVPLNCIILDLAV